MRRVRHLLGAGLVAGTMAVTVALTAAPATAAVMLDDFETGLAGMTGTLTGTGASPVVPGTPGASPARESGLGLGVSTVGQGTCDHLSGSSSALCGADTRKWAGMGGAVLSYALDFTNIGALLFDIAAFSDADPFDHYSGLNPNIWGDFIRISTVIGGAQTLLAEFTGIATSNPDVAALEHRLVSTGAGAALGAGMVAGASFETVRLGLNGQYAGVGTLMFEIRTTGSAEQVGLDNIRFAPVPLPGALMLAALGLGALGAVRRVQRRA